MLTLCVPTRAEFGVRQAWLADPEFMSYNVGWDVNYPGYHRDTGCIDWPETEWDAFERRLALPAAEQGYFYVRDGDEFVAHAHYLVHGDEAHIGFAVAPSRRGQRLGAEVLALLLERVWRDTTAIVAVNEFEDSRTPAVVLHERAGFLPEWDAREGYGWSTRIWRLPRP